MRIVVLAHARPRQLQACVHPPYSPTGPRARQQLPRVKSVPLNSSIFEWVDLYWIVSEIPGGTAKGLEIIAPILCKQLSVTRMRILPVYSLPTHEKVPDRQSSPTCAHHGASLRDHLKPCLEGKNLVTLRESLGEARAISSHKIRPALSGGMDWRRAHAKGVVLSERRGSALLAPF